jgi:AbrB family looped-hinge helix DNA binding protein
MRFETTIDRFGRIVLPKEIRDDLGLEPGAVVAVEEQGEAILLKPLRDEPGLVRKGPVLVYTGKARGDILGAVRSVREGRLRRIRKGAGK